MRNLIRKIIKEGEFDWIRDIKPILTIGDPVTLSNPKKSFRIHVTHGHGEDAATWSDNWMTVSENNQDKLIRYVKILDLMSKGMSVYDLAKAVIEEDKWWILNDEPSEAQKDKKTLEDEYGDDEEGKTDQIYEWLRDDFYDYSIISYDSYHQDEASLEKWYVTYFDEYGVEHKVNVNIS